MLGTRLSIAIVSGLGVSLAACSGGPPPTYLVDAARVALGAATSAKKGSPQQPSIAGLMAAAEKGDAEAQFRLGELTYAKGPRDRAWKWMCLAAAQGHGAAMSKLGYWSEYYDADLSRAFAWYERAAQHGHRVARNYSRRVAKSMTSEQRATSEAIIAGTASDGCEDATKSKADEAADS